MGSGILTSEEVLEIEENLETFSIMFERITYNSSEFINNSVFRPTEELLNKTNDGMKEEEVDKTVVSEAVQNEFNY